MVLAFIFTYKSLPDRDKMKYLVSCFTPLLLAFSSSLHAEWYEATGQAMISGGDINTARKIALEDAVKRTALAAGARVSSTEQILNGVLQQAQTQITSEGEIKALRILSEQRSGDLLTVTIQIDVEPQQSQCSTNQLKKSLLLPVPQLNARRDAVYGNLFNLGKDIATQMQYHLKDYSPAASISAVDYSIAQEQLQYRQTEQLFSQGYQFLLNSRITDLSLGDTTSSFWQSAKKERFFAINISLFDIFSQQVIYQQEYRTSADWPYKEQNTPLSHSQAFWQMPYGSKIDQLLQAIADDVQQQLLCQPLLSRISQVKNNQIQIGLGRHNGINTGDKLQLWQLQRHPGMPEIKRIKTAAETYEVTDLTEHHAWAKPIKQKLLNHVQQGDVVSILAAEE